MPSKNNQSHKEIKAITSRIKNSFVVSSFIYIMDSNTEKRLEALDKIRKMIELIDEQDLEWRKLNAGKDDNVSRIGNNFFDSLRTSLTSIRTTLT